MGAPIKAAARHTRSGCAVEVLHVWGRALGGDEAQGLSVHQMRACSLVEHRKWGREAASELLSGARVAQRQHPKCRVRVGGGFAHERVIRFEQTQRGVVGCMVRPRGGSMLHGRMGWVMA